MKKKHRAILFSVFIIILFCAFFVRIYRLPGGVPTDLEIKECKGISFDLDKGIVGGGNRILCIGIVK